MKNVLLCCFLGISASLPAQQRIDPPKKDTWPPPRDKADSSYRHARVRTEKKYVDGKLLSTSTYDAHGICTSTIANGQVIQKASVQLVAGGYRVSGSFYENGRAYSGYAWEFDKQWRYLSFRHSSELKKYDRKGRITEQALYEGGQEAHHYWYTYDSIGRASGMRAQYRGNSQGETQVKYDSAGRMLERKEQMSNNTGPFIYRYSYDDARNSVCKLFYFGEMLKTRSVLMLDSAGRPRCDSSWAYSNSRSRKDTVFTVRTFTYDTAGLGIRDVRRGKQTDQKWKYDSAGRLLEYEYASPERGVMQRNTYRYNERGLLVSLKDENLPYAREYTWEYTYYPPAPKTKK